MIRSRAFIYITSADFIVRSAYQMGKTPLLPIFAVSLGAGDLFLGVIVSVSTLTGMALKPLVGILSDRWGRRAWLLVGTTFFVGMPFLYKFVHTPEQLFALRLVHGVATAIYGPVTLAYVAELSGSRRAERLGWFSLARNGGYVVGPAAAGWMLLSMDPASVFTVIGILSSLAFLPLLLLPETKRSSARRSAPILRQSLRALRSGMSTPAVWLAGALDAKIYVAVYATKTFLPLHALSLGVSPATLGAIFAVQEGAHIALNPIGGRVSDRLGHLQTVSLGMALMGLALPLLTLGHGGGFLLVPAVVIGASQALVFPSTVALVSSRVDVANMGLGMGLVGTMKNAGKVAGPVLAGALVYWLDFEHTFQLMGLALLAGSATVWLSTRQPRKATPERRRVPA